MLSSNMKELVATLNEASKAYYSGNPIMSDMEYDRWYERLVELEEKTNVRLANSPTCNVGAEPVEYLSKFKHPFPALSLDKTKDANELINKFQKGISDSYAGLPSSALSDKVVVMWKEDGSTVQAYYEEGMLNKLVTRGNGEVGNIITHNAGCIEGLPLRIPYTGSVVVRGEAVMSYSEFERINSQLPDDSKYKNPRNLAAATLTMLDPKESMARQLTLKAFNLVYIEQDEYNPVLDSFSGRLNLLDKWGFEVVEYGVTPIIGLNHMIETMTDSVSHYPFPVDGLVCAMDNYSYTRSLPGTEHHPHIMSGYALKWADDVYETTLRDIEWSPSRTGLLNPVAIFDPVDIDGVTVQRASVHNLSVMRELNLKIGDRITVYRANMVIPQIAENLDKDKEPDSYASDEFLTNLIGKCPTCSSSPKVNISSDGIQTVCCPNPDCPEKLIGKLAHFCERDCMNIQGMSEDTIRKLYKAGHVKEYKDFFELDQKPAISFMPGFGKQSWKKMCEASKEAAHTDFVRFITSLSIPNIGKGQAKSLLKHLADNYDNLCMLADFDVFDTFEPVRLISYLIKAGYDFSTIDGFGTILANSLVDWYKVHLNFADDELPPFIANDTPEERVFYELQFNDRLVNSNPVESAIAGKSFCITGKLISFANRQELVAKIESLGGKWVDSVSSKTDYLINNDTASTSGKNKKAKELNIPIISEQNFIDMIGGM